MSKIVTLLFVALVASVVDASDSMDTHQSVEARVQANLASEIAKLKQKHDTVDLTGKYMQLFESSQSKQHYVTENTQLTWKTARKETIELMFKTLSTGGSDDCYERINHIGMKGQILLANVVQCTEGVVNTAFKNVAEAELTYQHVLKTLTNWRGRTNVCAPYSNTPAAVKGAIWCIESIEKQMKSNIASSVPSVVAKIDQTNNFLVAAETSLYNCAKDLAPYRSQSQISINEAITCYRNRLGNGGRIYYPIVETVNVQTPDTIYRTDYTSQRVIPPTV